MDAELTSAIAKKAMAYDLIDIIEEAPEKQAYTAEEVIQLIKTYIKTAA